MSRSGVISKSSWITCSSKLKNRVQKHPQGSFCFSFQVQKYFFFCLLWIIFKSQGLKRTIKDIVITLSLKGTPAEFENNRGALDFIRKYSSMLSFPHTTRGTRSAPLVSFINNILDFFLPCRTAWKMLLSSDLIENSLIATLERNEEDQEVVLGQGG